MSNLKKDRIVLCCSGDLGLHCLKELEFELDVSFVLTDSKSNAIVTYCKEKDIHVVCGNPRSQKVYSEVALLGGGDILLSINFLYLFDEKFLALFSNRRINIHGGLLPKYRGRAPHIWAIINGEKELGISVHDIELGCDTGAILKQEVIQITTKCTGGDVIKIFKEKYPRLLLETLNDLKNGTLVAKKQDESLSSYYQKRSPEDGLIDWNKKSIEIYNWIRALTRPYPGAFSYFKDNKIIFWNSVILEKNSFYSRAFKNGEIVSVQNKSLVVKTGDSYIKIYYDEQPTEYEFKIGDNLNG